MNVIICNDEYHYNLLSMFDDSLGLPLFTQLDVNHVISAANNAHIIYYSTEAEVVSDYSQVLAEHRRSPTLGTWSCIIGFW